MQTVLLDATYAHSDACLFPAKVEPKNPPVSTYDGTKMKLKDVMRSVNSFQDLQMSGRNPFGTNGYPSLLFVDTDGVVDRSGYCGARTPQAIKMSGTLRI